jgi:hypothetical protein
MRAAICVFLVCISCARTAVAQIDSTKRELVELGYDHPLSGAGPTAGYLFGYFNEPDFLRKGSSLRLAIAPVYADSEYGIGRALGPQTDLGLGLAGGGFAQDHAEIRQGQYYRAESFYGHGGTAALSLYHLFDPGRMIPLSGVLRQSVQYSNYQRTADTATGFILPPDHTTFITRAGLRFGGELPLLPPADALEISTWYEGRVRDRGGSYGLQDDRVLERVSHFMWLKTVFIHVLPDSGRRIGLGISAGTSIDADRLNGYGLGGLLPLTSDFPRNIPGYFYEEITARRFVLVTGHFGVPIDRDRRFLVNLLGTSSLVSYVPGLEQPGSLNSGVAAGLQYNSPSHAWNFLFSYGYGIEAMRSGSRGAHSISLAFQYDLLAGRGPAQPGPLAPLPVFKH